MSDIEEQRFGPPGSPAGSIGLADLPSFDRTLAWAWPGLYPEHTAPPASDLPAIALSPVTAGCLAVLEDAPVLLRDAVEADAGAIAAIEAVSFEPGEETFSIKRVRGLIANPRVFTSVALAGDHVVGWSAGLIRRHEHGLSGRVYAVAIAPDARRRGIGRRLTLGLLERMRDAGANRVYLETRRNNAAAIELYRKLGFVSHRYLANYYGRHRHGLRMRLELV